MTQNILEQMNEQAKELSNLFQKKKILTEINTKQKVIQVGITWRVVVKGSFPGTSRENLNQVWGGFPGKQVFNKLPGGSHHPACTFGKLCCRVKHGSTDRR